MELANKHSFIFESGGAIYIPKNYFNFDPAELVKNGLVKTGQEEGSVVIELGQPYQEVRRILHEVAQKAGVSVFGFGDMTIDDLCRLTHLSPEEAARAKARNFQESFLIIDVSPENQLEAEKRLRKEISNRPGYEMRIGGSFYQIMAGSNKEKAFELLVDFYRRQFGQITTVGFGDTESDLSFLEKCDQGYLVKRPPGKSVGVETAKESIKRVDGIGPIGFNQVVLDLLSG